MVNVTIIDYGVGNLLSVQRGFEHCGARVTVTSDPEVILRSEKLVLPGVGAFRDAMAELEQRGLPSVIHTYVASGKPLLGICLGMQMLLDESEEFGVTKGLGLVSGKVVPVPVKTESGEPQKIPHIGWNALHPASGSWAGTILDGVQAGSSVYFVHSYMAQPTKAEHRLADCVYGGCHVSAVIASGNVLGCQFHPEKSGEIGLSILSAFCARQ